MDLVTLGLFSFLPTYVFFQMYKNSFYKKLRKELSNKEIEEKDVAPTTEVKVIEPPSPSDILFTKTHLPKSSEQIDILKKTFNLLSSNSNNIFNFKNKKFKVIVSEDQVVLGEVDSSHDVIRDTLTFLMIRRTSQDSYQLFGTATFKEIQDFLNIYFYPDYRKNVEKKSSSTDTSSMLERINRLISDKDISNITYKGSKYTVTYSSSFFKITNICTDLYLIYSSFNSKFNKHSYIGTASIIDVQEILKLLESVPIRKVKVSPVIDLLKYFQSCDEYLFFCGNYYRVKIKTENDFLKVTLEGDKRTSPSSHLSLVYQKDSFGNYQYYSYSNSLQIVPNKIFSGDFLKELEKHNPVKQSENSVIKVKIVAFIQMVLEKAERAGVVITCSYSFYSFCNYNLIYYSNFDSDLFSKTLEAYLTGLET